MYHDLESTAHSLKFRGDPGEQKHTPLHIINTKAFLRLFTDRTRHSYFLLSYTYIFADADLSLCRATATNTLATPQQRKMYSKQKERLNAWRQLAYYIFGENLKIKIKVFTL